MVQDLSQQTFFKPSNSVSLDFHSGFLNHTLDQIKEFVEVELGEGGLGQGEDLNDSLSSDTFGIIDERTADNNTILYLVFDYVDSFQEAEMRVAWDNATEHDKALMRCFWSEHTESDIRLLANTIDGINDAMSIEEMSDRVYNYMESLRTEDGVFRWFEIRLDAEYTVMAHGGIWLTGAPNTISGRLDFDDDGVMRSLNRTDHAYAEEL